MAWNAKDSAKDYPGLTIRNGVYYWQQMVRGKRYNESLGVKVGTKNDEKLARRILNAKQAALQERRIGDYEAMRVKRSCSSIGELFVAFEAYAARRQLKSWKERPHALRNIVSLVHGCEKSAVDGLGLDVLTADLMLAYESRALEIGEDDPIAACNSIVSQRRKARGLFPRKARIGYGDLTIPECVDGFLVAGDVREQVQEWQRPSEDIVARTKKAARVLRRKQIKPDIQIAYLLAYALAMRCQEIAAVRWSWFEMLDGQLVCSIRKRPEEKYKPKGRSGYVPVPPAVWEWLQELRRAGEDHLMSGTDYGRYNFLQRDFAPWMRALGWTSHHCAHELRRLRGCEWWSDPKVGPALCSEWLRHSSLLVTQRHYGKPAMPEAAVSIDL